MSMASQRIGTKYDRLVLYRAFLLWFQLTLGFAVGLLFLSTVNLSHFRYWGGRAAVAALLIGLGPAMPYLISAAFSRRLVTSNRLSIWLYIIILLLGTVMVSYVYLLGLNQTYGTLPVIGAQTLLYMVAASVLWRDSPNARP
jgi:hypothetical protein